MITDKPVTIENITLGGIPFTRVDNIMAKGKDVNRVLLNNVLRAMTMGEFIDIYECVNNGVNVKLVNGEQTTPIRVAVGLTRQGYLGVARSYLTGDWEIINWNTVGAVGYHGKLVWLHPKINVKRKTDNRGGYNPRRASANSGVLYRNLSDLKRNIKNGSRFRIVSWAGKPNRKGMILIVSGQPHKDGFNVDAYAHSRKIGEDFIGYDTHEAYRFEDTGIIKVYNKDSGEFKYSLEPLISG